MKAKVLLLGLGLIGWTAEGLAQATCPLLVPRQESFLQPKRLQPAEVNRKNAAGCLSPADAVYGPNGCPRKLCPKPI
jgi:hypothetical protein